MKLADKQCVACREGTAPLGPDAIAKLLPQLDGWQVAENRRLTKTFTLPDFKQALALVDRIGAMAEEQNHHPEINLAWGKVRVDIWTHKVNGLTESDFVFAAKCDELARR